MIKNDRQYRITKAQVRTFENAIADLVRQPVPQGVDRALSEVQQRALESQVEEMISDLQEYEALKSGNVTKFDAQSLDELPSLLVKARIARGMTHRDLAERLNIKEQQVQRWEANDYHGTTLENLKAIAEALRVVLTQHLSFSPAEAGVLRESNTPYVSDGKRRARRRDSKK
jgi:transcriptional regulator with XRE-family HTH domain